MGINCHVINLTLALYENKDIVFHNFLIIVKFYKL